MSYKQDKGELHIYCSYAPGAGKTYQMLKDVYAFTESGIDIVIATLFDSKRNYLSDEKIKARLLNAYALTNAPLSANLNMEDILQRNPNLCVIDEMIAMNTCRKHRLYNDFDEILSKGISILTTLNLIHVKTLVSSYFQIGACKANVIMDDTLLWRADKIIFVDDAPQDLVERYQSEVLFPKSQNLVLYPYYSAQRLKQYRDVCLDFLYQNCILLEKDKNIYNFQPKNANMLTAF